MQEVQATRTLIDGKAFGDILRDKRQANNLSQENLSYEMNWIWQQKNLPGKISVGWVKRVEEGTVNSINRMRAAVAAQVLGIPVTHLLPKPPVDKTKKSFPISETDIAVTLRGYGLADDQIEELLIVIQDYRKALK